MSGYSQPSPMAQDDSKTKPDQKVDYSNLPCPSSYEEIHREATNSLRPELFEGYRFSFNKMLNQKFFLSHNVSMGPTEIPTQNVEVIKIPTSRYEFGANYFDPKLMLIGRVTTDGIVTGRVRSELTDKFTINANGQLANDERMCHGRATFDYKGSDYRTQLQVATNSQVSANYIQHVTPQLSLGGEVLWSGEHRKSGVGYAARYENDKMIASGQVSSNGMATMNYVQKVTERISLATELTCNYITREATASVGYDYTLRQSRLRAGIDSNGTSSAHLEQIVPFPIGLTVLLSGEVDHMRKDYKFGAGLNIG